MAVKLKDFIIGLARKAGFDPASDAAKPFFDAIPDTEVPEDVQKGVDNNLISIADAKNNHPILKNHYHKQALDGIDSTIMDLMAEMEVDEETKNLVLAEKSSFKRVPLLAKKIAELTAAKAGASTPDKKKIQDQIDQLHLQIKTEKEGRVADKKAFEDQVTGFKTKYKIDTLLSGHKTIHDDGDPEVKSTIINTLINKALQDNQAKFAFDETGNLTLIKNDGTNYYGENHQQITPAQFIEQTLAKTKQLKVSPAPNGANQQRGNPPKKLDGTPENTGQQAVTDLNTQALKDFAEGSKNGFQPSY